MTEQPVTNCKRAKLFIALSVGGDLDEIGESVMKAHLADCPPCLQHLQAMKSNLRPLQNPDEASPYTLHDSLWPDLCERLPARNGFSVLKYNGWWVAGAVAVACVAIAMFWQTESHRNQWPEYTATSTSARPGAFPEPRLPDNPLSVGLSFSGPHPPPKRRMKPVDPAERFFRLTDSGIILPVLRKDDDPNMPPVFGP